MEKNKCDCWRVTNNNQNTKHAPHQHKKKQKKVCNCVSSYRMGSWMHRNSKVPTVVEGSKGVKTKWLDGDTTVSGKSFLRLRAIWKPPQPVPRTTMRSLLFHRRADGLPILFATALTIVRCIFQYLREMRKSKWYMYCKKKVPVKLKGTPESVVWASEFDVLLGSIRDFLEDPQRHENRRRLHKQKNGHSAKNKFSCLYLSV